MRPRTILLGALLLGACGPGPAPWPEVPQGALLTVVARPSATQVELLQPFTVEVDLWRREGIEVDFTPRLPEGTEGTVETAPGELAGGGSWQRTVLALRATTGPGELVVPPFEVRQRGGEAVAASEELRIAVRSLLEGAEAALEPPGRLLDAPFDPWPWVAAAGFLLAGGFVAARLLRPRPAPPPEPAVALPAHVLALREIERVRAMPRATAAQVDAFYVALSHALRVYVEARFGLNAPERTTEEFLAEAERHGGIAEEQRAALRRFLHACDLVKFAAMVPAEQEHLEALLTASAFVHATVPVAPEPQVAASGAVA